MKKRSRIFIAFFIIGLFSISINSVIAQTKLVAVYQSYDIANIENDYKDAVVFKFTNDENPLQQIINYLEKGNFTEVHIYTLAETNNIIFHGLSLYSGNLSDNEKLLKSFQKFDISIVFHSSSLGKDDAGVQFINSLAELMGNSIKVE